MPSINETRVNQIIRSEGPFASVLLRAPSAVANAEEGLHTRWHNARRQLHDDGAPEELLEDMDQVINGIEHSDGPAVALVAGENTPTLIEFLDDDLQGDLGVHDSLARLGPVLESRQRSVPHLIVVTDRTGADIISMQPGEGDVDGDRSTEVVEGETLHLHRGQPGGWSQRRFQQRAENQWESNATEVAEAVADAAQRIGARIITIAGDVRAVGFLREHLPARAAGLAVVLDGQSDELIAEETVKAVADVVARDITEALREHDELASKDLATNGAELTLAALAQGRVARLLVHDDPSDSRRASFDPAGPWCSADLDDTIGLPPGHRAVEGRLVDVAIRSTLLSDGEVRFVPRHGGPDDSLGAILRW